MGNNIRLELLKKYQAEGLKVKLNTSGRFYTGIILEVSDKEFSFEDRVLGKMFFTIELIESIVPAFVGGKNDRS